MLKYIENKIRSIYKIYKSEMQFWYKFYNYFTKIFYIIMLIFTAMLCRSDTENTIWTKIYIVMQLILIVICFFEIFYRWLLYSNDKDTHGILLLKYLLKKSTIFDIFILILMIFHVFTIKETNFQSIITVILVLFQLARICIYEVNHGSVGVLIKVLNIHKSALFSAYLIAFILTYITSFAVFKSESSFNSTLMTSWKDALYFVSVSFLTIGYGDIIPGNYVTKFIIVFTSIFATTITIIPEFIIGLSFNLELKKYGKKKKYKKYLKASVLLIQSACRNYMYIIKNDKFTIYDVQKFSFSYKNKYKTSDTDKKQKKKNSNNKNINYDNTTLSDRCVNKESKSSNSSNKDEDFDSISLLIPNNKFYFVCAFIRSVQLTYFIEYYQNQRTRMFASIDLLNIAVTDSYNKLEKLYNQIKLQNKVQKPKQIILKNPIHNDQVFTTKNEIQSDIANLNKRIDKLDDLITKTLEKLKKDIS